jgi:hypothetical protein
MMHFSEMASGTDTGEFESSREFQDESGNGVPA